MQSHTISPCKPSAPSDPGCEQPAGLSTAESDLSTDPSKHGSSSRSLGSRGGGGNESPTQSSVPSLRCDALVEPHYPSAVSPPPRGKSLFTTAARSFGKSEDTSSLNNSITNSAPTVLIRPPSRHSADDLNSSRHLRSIMSSRTLHESLHRGIGKSNGPAGPGPRPSSVSFSRVNIREYERVLGDNPSVRFGPPLSIGWRHAPDTVSADVDDFEDAKGPPRSSAEYLVPRAAREQMLREHAGVSRREMAGAVREIHKEKARRRRTAINLNMQKAEERVQGVRRKIKKILKPSASYEVAERKLWEEAHAVAMEKARRLEESIRRGESVSAGELYRVGTPCRNILPSRRNLTETLEREGERKESTGVVSITTEKKTEWFDESSLNMGTECGIRRLGRVRSSGNIVALETTESEEIFAKLVLDDASNHS